MVLLKALKDMDNDTVIKVAAKDGSSFFFIGKVQDLRKNMSKYNEACFEHARKKMVHIANTLMSMVENPPTMERYFKQNFAEDNDMSLDDYFEYCRLFFDKYKRIKEASLVEHERFNEYVHLAKREVTEVFDADPTVDDATVIYITGYEIGAYWFQEEAVKKPCCFKLGNNLEDRDVDAKSA